MRSHRSASNASRVVAILCGLIAGQALLYSRSEGPAPARLDDDQQAADGQTSSTCIGILIDTTKPRMGTPAPTRDLRTSLKSFVATLHTARPDTEFALMEFGGAAVITQKFTTSRADVDKRLDRLIPGQQATAVMLEGLVDMSRELAKRPCAQRVIVSVDLDSQETSVVQGQRVADEMRKARAALWAVSVRAGGNASAAQRDVVLDVLTEATGGSRQTAVSVAALEDLMFKVAAQILERTIRN